MHWIPWISFESWDGKATRWVSWRRLSKYRLDGNHKWSPFILGKITLRRQDTSFSMRLR